MRHSKAWQILHTLLFAILPPITITALNWGHVGEGWCGANSRVTSQGQATVDSFVFVSWPIYTLTRVFLSCVLWVCATPYSSRFILTLTPAMCVSWYSWLGTWMSVSMCIVINIVILLVYSRDRCELQLCAAAMVWCSFWLLVCSGFVSLCFQELTEELVGSPIPEPRQRSRLFRSHSESSDELSELDLSHGKKDAFVLEVYL